MRVRAGGEMIISCGGFAPFCTRPTDLGAEQGEVYHPQPAAATCLGEAGGQGRGRSGRSRQEAGIGGRTSRPSAAVGHAAVGVVL